jgi:hypothetical protein
MKKKCTSSYSTNLLLKTATELGLETKVINHNLPLAEIKSQQQTLRIMDFTLDLNTRVSTKITRNKYFTSQILRQLGSVIPHSIFIDIKLIMTDNT